MQSVSSAIEHWGVGSLEALWPSAGAPSACARSGLGMSVSVKRTLAVVRKERERTRSERQRVTIADDRSARAVGGILSVLHQRCQFLSERSLARRPHVLSSREAVRSLLRTASSSHFLHRITLREHAGPVFP